MQVRAGRRATTTSWCARASTSSSRPRGCGTTSASGSVGASRRRVPHPRRHRSRRVHDGRQQQPLHERHGERATCVRPPAGRRAAGARVPRRLRASRRATRPRRRRDRRVGRLRGGHVHPLRRAALQCTRRTSTSSSGRCGTSRPRPTTKRPLLLHYHPLVIYRFQVLKQADVVAGALPAGADSSRTEQKRADFEYYDPLTTGDSTLSAVVQSIIAAEVGYRDLALRVLPLRRSSSTSPTCTATRPTACTSRRPAACGTRSSTGFGGMRDHNGTLDLRPAPARRLAAPHVPDPGAGEPSARRGRPRADQLHAARTVDPAEVSVRGERVTVSGADPHRRRARRPRSRHPRPARQPAPGRLEQRARDGLHRRCARPGARATTTRLTSPGRVGRRSTSRSSWLGRSPVRPRRDGRPTRSTGRGHPRAT